MADGPRLEAQGKLDEALAAFTGQKDWDGAVRVALALSRHLDAGKFCMEAQRPWDAAVCFQRANAPKECLAALLKVGPSHPRYRQAAVQVVRVAGQLKTPLDTLSMWFMPFLGYAPASPAEAEAKKDIADGYAAAGKTRLAVSILRTVLGAYPADVDSQERLARLESTLPASSPSSLTPLPPGVRASAAPPVFGSQPTPAPMAAPSAFSTGPRSSSPSGVLAAPRRKLGSLLVERGLLRLSLLERLTREQPELAKNELALAEAVVTAGLLTEQQVLEVLSAQHQLPFIVAADLVKQVSPAMRSVLTEDQARAWRVVPFKLEDRQLHVAMEDPRDITTVDRLRFATRLRIAPCFTTPSALRRATEKLYRGVDPQENLPSWHGKVFDPAEADGGGRKLDSREFARPPSVLGGVSLALPPAPASTTMPAAGSMLGPRYRLDAVLGEGGSASVFRATDLELNEPVALKVFHPATEREGETLLARFKLELSLNRALTHPNIVRLFDLGSVGPWRYLSMELLQGKDLHERLVEAKGPLGFREAFWWLEQTCRALACAHEKDVVHRDVKPQNVFVTTDGDVKLMDFGIARKRNAAGVTVMGMIGGTPEYMAPEQINSFSDVTGAADLYSLGVMAYQVFTGKLPFEHRELTRLLLAHGADAPVPPRQVNPAVPELLERLILQLLEKDPARRPESAAWVGLQFRALRTATRH